MPALLALFNPYGNDVNGNGTAVANIATKVVPETGTTIAFGAAHYGASIKHTNASASALTLNKAAPVGAWGKLTQCGAGAVTVGVETGGTKHSNGSKYKTNGQGAQIYYECLGNSDGQSADWWIAGDLTT